MARSNTRYRPGHRSSRYRDSGQMSENRLAWIRTHLGQAVIMYYEEDEEGYKEDEENTTPIEYGPTVRLMIPQKNGRTLFQDITALTLPELEMLREFYNLLFDLAEPSVRERDRIAQDAYDKGDDSYARSYRPVPQFVVRKGTVKPYGEGVLHRLESLFGGTGDKRGFTGGFRRDGNELVDSESKEDGSQDNEPTPDEPESLREVGGLGEPSGGLQSPDSSEGSTSPST